MSLPKFPTQNQIAKLSRIEVEKRLLKMGEEPPTQRCWADDPEDDFLTVDKSKPKCSCDDCRYKASPLELKKFPQLSYAARRLHILPYERWLDGLSLKQVQAHLRELNVEIKHGGTEINGAEGPQKSALVLAPGTSLKPSVT